MLRWIGIHNKSRAETLSACLMKTVLLSAECIMITDYYVLLNQVTPRTS